MNKILLFGLLLLLFDLPFIKYVVSPQYAKLNMAMNTKIVFVICAYAVMVSAWFLIKGDVGKAALVGFVIYGTYAFTLAAILPGYTLSLGMTEIIWGTLLFTVATYLTNQIIR